MIDLDVDMATRLVTLCARMSGVKTSTVTHPHRHARQLTRPMNKVMLPLVSARARYREAFFRAGLPVQERFEGLYGRGGRGNSSLFSAVSDARCPGNVWIGIAPFAKHRGKSYPLELVEEVVAILGREIADVKVFLFGGGDDECKILAGWAQMYGFAVSPAVARMGFPAELSLLSHIDVMLTMGFRHNMHLASLVGTKWCDNVGCHSPVTAVIRDGIRTSRLICRFRMPCRPLLSLWRQAVSSRGLSLPDSHKASSCS